MADQIGMKYEQVEAHIQDLRQTVEALEAVLQEAQAIAGEMADGTLLGLGGSAFVEAIQGRLTQALTRLTEGINTQADFVQSEMTQLIAADQKSASQFN